MYTFSFGLPDIAGFWSAFCNDCNETSESKYVNVNNLNLFIAKGPYRPICMKLCAVHFSFLTMISRGFLLRGAKSRDCLVTG